MKKRQFIIDCDTGTDDAIAIVAALGCEAMEIVGITGVNGNVPKTLIRWIIETVAEMPEFSCAKAVLADILPYLGVSQSFPEGDPAGQMMTVPDLTGKTAAEAAAILKELSLTAKISGNEEQITAQIPPPGTAVPGGSELLLYLGENPEQPMVVVPDFTGMNRQQAVDAAGKLGLYIKVEGNTELLPQVVVTAQSHPKQTQVPMGTTITLTFTDVGVQD